MFIKSGSYIPCMKQMTITLTPNDKSLIILEGEAVEASQNVPLSEIKLPGRNKKDAMIDIKFRIDANNILTVSAKN